MAINRNELDRLAAKLLDGTITSEEQEQLNHWINTQLPKDNSNAPLFKQIDLARKKRDMLKNILMKIEEDDQPVKTKRGQLYRFLKYSAAVAVILFIGFISQQNLFMPKQAERIAIHNIIELEADTVFSGGNSPTLTLGNGQVIQLSEKQAGIIQKNGLLTYTNGESAVNLQAGLDANVNAMLTLSTGAGGTYQLILPDGSKVWLNAKSTIRFPSKFSAHERKVCITGEAFFEVVKNTNQPFRVNSKDYQVEVLGTSFNMSSYNNDKEDHTTLLEGLVRIKSEPQQAKTAVLLRPGEQASISAERVAKRAVDVSPFVAWKEGLFYFDGASPQTAMKQLARWYDLDVSFSGNLSNISFFGMIDRKKSLGSIIRILEKSGVKFRLQQIDGKKVLKVISD